MTYYFSVEVLCAACVLAVAERWFAVLRGLWLLRLVLEEGAVWGAAVVAFGAWAFVFFLLPRVGVLLLRFFPLLVVGRMALVSGG